MFLYQLRVCLPLLLIRSPELKNGKRWATRENANNGILQKFEEMLNGYFDSDKPKEIVLPSVGYCADHRMLNSWPGNAELAKLNI